MGIFKTSVMQSKRAAIHVDETGGVPCGELGWIGKRLESRQPQR